MDQEVREILRKDLDTDWWDQQVAASSLKNPMIYSWVMDILAEDWSVFTNDKNAVPVPYTTTLGIRRARQHPFSRQIDFLNFEAQSVFLKSIKHSFKEIDLGISVEDGLENDQVFQYIELNDEPAYSTNAKRLIKKAEQFEYEFLEDVSDLVTFYHENTREKIGLPELYSVILGELMLAFLKHEKGFYIAAKQDGRVVGGIFVILDKDIAYYLIADGDAEAKKEGLIFGLMNQSIQHTRDMGYSRFDFGGSNVQSVADFYRKFGATDQPYARLKQNELPGWFKLIQKFKRA